MERNFNELHETKQACKSAVNCMIKVTIILTNFLVLTITWLFKGWYFLPQQFIKAMDLIIRNKKTEAMEHWGQ